MKHLFYLVFIFLFACQTKETKPKYEALPVDSTAMQMRAFSARIPEKEIPVIVKGKRIVPIKGGDNGVFLKGLSPGDTIVLQAKQNPYSYVYIGDTDADSSSKVVVINEGLVELTAGFAFNNATGIKVVGTDSISYYINQHVGSNTGGGGGIVSIEGKSRDIEVANFWGDSSQYGLWVKNEHFCDSALSKWVLDSMHFHHFKLTNLRQHGSYIGATELENKTRPKSCNGKDVYLNPSRIGNLRIHDAVIHNVGKNGLMVSDARVGQSEIYNVSISDAGFMQKQQDQGTGIAIGGACVIKVYNNTVRNTWLWGIAAFGGQIEISNNIVENSGAVGWGENIRSTVDPNVTQGAKIVIRNNVTKNPGSGSDNIRVYSGAYGNENIVCNNTGEVVVDNGIGYSKDCNVNPQKQVFKSGYFVIDRKRLYYKLYTDSTYQTSTKKF